MYVNPWRQWNVLRDEIDRLFDSPYEGRADTTQPFMGGWWPAVDVFDNKDNVVVKVEIPGLKREDIEISLHEGVLSLSGERKMNEKYANSQAHRSERFVGRFQRSLTLPSPVNVEQCKANYQDGILTVTLPKAEEAKPKQIEVQSVGK